MAWVANSGAGGWVWDAGPYLPGNGVQPRCPHHTLLEGIDCGDIDYVVIDSSHAPGSFSYADARYDSYSWQYDDGGPMGFSPTLAKNLSNVPTTPHLYVVFYNLAFDDPADYTPDVADGMDLVPSNYATGGLATATSAPDGDDFADAIVLDSALSGSFDLPANAEWALMEADETYARRSDSPTIWYAFTPPVSGDYAFTFPELNPVYTPDWIAQTNAYREDDHPGEYPAMYPASWYDWNHYPSDPLVAHLDGLRGGETIWIQVSLAASYAGTITWTGPSLPATNPEYLNSSNFGGYTMAVIPPRGPLGNNTDDTVALGVLTYTGDAVSELIQPESIFYYSNNAPDPPTDDGIPYSSLDGIFAYVRFQCTEANASFRWTVSGPTMGTSDLDNYYSGLDVTDDGFQSHTMTFSVGGAGSGANYIGFGSAHDSAFFADLAAGTIRLKITKLDSAPGDPSFFQMIVTELGIAYAASRAEPWVSGWQIGSVTW